MDDDDFMLLILLGAPSLLLFLGFVDLLFVITGHPAPIWPRG